MPTITLSDGYDAKLKSLVTEPFVDTRESIVQHLIDEEVARRGITSVGNGYARARAENHRRLNPDSPDSLSFTRLLSATIDGQELDRPKWNGVMDHLHILGYQRLGSFEALKRATAAHVRQGRFEENGYKYLSQGDFSIQGVPADVAWANSLRLARVLRVPMKLVVEWRDTEGAVHPGQTAVLEWTPSN